MPKPDEGLVVFRLLKEAQKKTDGSTPEMMLWLQRRKEFMVQEADTRIHDKALDILALDAETDLPVPKMVPGGELKKGMIVEANREFSVTLTKDAYIDPADNKLTIDAVRNDNGESWRSVIEPKAAYFVSQPPTIEPPAPKGPSLGMGF